MMRILVPFITFIGGLYFFLEFMLPEEVGGFTFGYYHQELSISLALISSMAVGLGVINLSYVHGRILIRRANGSLVSFFLLGSFLATFVVLSFQWYYNEISQGSWNSTLALVNYTKGETSKSDLGDLEVGALETKLEKNLELLQVLKQVPSGVDESEYRAHIVELRNRLSANRPNADLASRLDNLNKVVNELAVFRLLGLTQAKKEAESTLLSFAERLIVHGLFFPLGLSMFSLLAFYIAYAAYRSFRVRSLEAAIMMLAALVVMLGQVPQGVLYLSSDLPMLRLWLMEYLSTPAFRAIYFSSAIAGLSLAVRMWLSLDKNPFSSK